MSTVIPTSVNIAAAALVRGNKYSKINIPDLKENGLINNVKSVEIHGFTIKPENLEVTNFSLLINSFITIFECTGYLCEKEEHENVKTLIALFSGGQLKSVNRIKWNSGINDKRKTGSDTWKQLYYIFYRLWRSKIIIHNDSKTDSIKSAIGYRLINTFTNGKDKPVLEYQQIDYHLYQLTRKGNKSKKSKAIELTCPKCNPRESLKNSVDILITTLLYGAKRHQKFPESMS
jgi:hypothetical protein